MSPTGIGLLLSVFLFVGILFCLDAGFRFGKRTSQSHPTAHEGIGAMEAAIFALVGLLLGFSFAGAMSRLDARRHLIIEEATAISTAYLRIDLMPAQSQPEMKQLLRGYVDARLSAYSKMPSMTAAEQEISRAEAIQQSIWSRAIEASHSDSTGNIARVLLPALNQMFDVETARVVMLRTHLPNLIMFLMFSVTLLSGVMAGYAMSKRQSRSVLHMLLYAASIAVTVFAIIDLDHPRSGLIRLDSADKALLELRQSMK